MDKIDGTSGYFYRPDVSNKEKKDKKASSAKKSGFGGVLGQLFGSRSEAAGDLGPAAEIHSDEELKALIDDIHEMGENLLRFPGIDNLARYKQAVKDFLSHTTGHAFRAEEHISRRNILNQKKYTIIKVVDEKLEKLSKAVLSSQSKQIELLSDIEEIQGLLVDILHAS